MPIRIIRTKPNRFKNKYLPNGVCKKITDCMRFYFFEERRGNS